METVRLNRRTFDSKPKTNNTTKYYKTNKYVKQNKSYQKNDDEQDEQDEQDAQDAQDEQEKNTVTNIDLNDGSWSTVVRIGKNKKQTDENKVVENDGKVVENDGKMAEKELEEKYAKMKTWREARDKVSNEYLRLLCSYTKQEILTKIISAQHIIDKQTGQPHNYVTLSCRAYNGNQEQVDVLTENTFKFVLNQFFSNEYFVKQIKEHYKKMGYNVGFRRRKFDDNEHYTYTDIKIYYC